MQQSIFLQSWLEKAHFISPWGQKVPMWHVQSWVYSNWWLGQAQKNQALKKWFDKCHHVNTKIWKTQHPHWHTYIFTLSIGATVCITSREPKNWVWFNFWFLRIWASSSYTLLIPVIIFHLLIYNTCFKHFTFVLSFFLRMNQPCAPTIFQHYLRTSKTVLLILRFHATPVVPSGFLTLLQIHRTLWWVL